MMFHTYNSSTQDSSQFSPYFLLYGFEPDGPADYVGGIGPFVGRPGAIERGAGRFLTQMKVNLDRARSNLVLAAASS